MRLADDPPEVAPLDVLLGQEELVLPAPEVVHGDDVRVMEGAEEVGLVAELRDGVGIGRQLGAQPLDHHRAAKAPFAGGHRRVDLGHPAEADPLDQRVAADDRDRRAAAAVSMNGAFVGAGRRASRRKLPIASTEADRQDRQHHPRQRQRARAAAAGAAVPASIAEPAGERQRGHRHRAVDATPGAGRSSACSSGAEARSGGRGAGRRGGVRRRGDQQAAPVGDARPRRPRARRFPRGCPRRARGSPPAPASPTRPVSATGAAETARTCPATSTRPEAVRCEARAS